MYSLILLSLCLTEVLPCYITANSAIGIEKSENFKINIYFKTPCSETDTVQWSLAKDEAKLLTFKF